MNPNIRPTLAALRKMPYDALWARYEQLLELRARRALGRDEERLLHNVHAEVCHRSYHDSKTHVFHVRDGKYTYLHEPRTPRPLVVEVELFIREGEWCYCAYEAERQFDHSDVLTVASEPLRASCAEARGIAQRRFPQATISCAEACTCPGSR